MKVFNYSKYINYTWDNEIISYLSQIHEFKIKQEMYIVKSPVKVNRMVEIAKIQSVEASNKIEGIITTNSRLKQICENKTTPRNRDENEIMGYRDVLNRIHENFKYMEIKNSILLQLHRDLFKFSPYGDGGRFKGSENFIEEIREDNSRYIRFTPLSAFETPDAMERLCEEFNIVFSKQEIDPLILIPIFILDFLCIHPFRDGNGRMSRLLMLLLLYKSGYQIGKYISLEQIIEQNKNGYYASLEESSKGWHEEKNNPTAFIKYTLSIILSAYRDFDERVKVTCENQASSAIQIGVAVNSFYGVFTKKDIIIKCPTISETTIERILKNLVEQKYIEKHGDRKSTFYIRKEDIMNNPKFISFIKQECSQEFNNISINKICQIINQTDNHIKNYINNSPFLSQELVTDAIEGLERIKNCFFNKLSLSPTKKQLKALLKILEKCADIYMTNENEKLAFKIFSKIVEKGIDNNYYLV